MTLTPERMRENEAFIEARSSMYPHRLCARIRDSPTPLILLDALKIHFLRVPLGNHVVWGFTSQEDADAFDKFLQERRS